jgi:conjugative relaxase-like TrwC/TraI family protein
LSSAQAGQLPATWFGQGLGMVGAVAGQSPTEADVRSIFGQLRDPASTEKEPVFLGRPPRSFKATAVRVAAALAAEPDATPERRVVLTRQAEAAGRRPVAYYDLTFSPAKSVSVYWAALLAAGDEAGADLVRQTIKDAAEVALRYAEEHAAYTRTGYHGSTKDGRSVGRYEQADGFVGLMWEHLTNRESEPQLHIHATVLNRVVTTCDGQIRALDGRGFRPIKEAICAAFDSAVEDLMTERFEVAFGLREDGKAREIIGIDAELRAMASTRRAQIEVRGAQLVADYLQQHGRMPDAAAVKEMMQAATMATRKAKDDRSPLEAAREWAGRQRDRLAVAAERVSELAGELAGQPRPVAEPAVVVEFNPAAYRDVVAEAVVNVQAQYSSWTLSNIAGEIARLGPDLGAVPSSERQAAREQLVAMVTAPGNEFGVVQLTANDPVVVPAELRRADGRSVYRPHVDEKFCLATQLAAEDQVVVAARQQSAPALDSAEAAVLEVELSARGLGPDQVAAVLGVLGSGRAGDVLIGPAGTGKSYTMGTLAQVWQERFGGRVLGLATSQIATSILTGEGLEAINTSVFLHRFTPAARGEVADRVRPGDLFILDESGMSSVAEMTRIAELVHAGGGKLLCTGDNAQFGAPAAAGGLFSLLADRNGAFELGTVRRFAAEWEGPASLRLRGGDASVLDEYEARGRLVGGTLEQMQTAIVDRAVADTLRGLRVLVSVSSNEDAQTLGARIRARLIEHGVVEPIPVARLGAMGANSPISVGDRIAARRNDRTLRIDPGVGAGAAAGADMVVNREVYTVLGVGEHATVRVLREADGAVVHLTRDYLHSHVSLAYAGTGHAGQGKTVDVGLKFVDERTTREELYVGGSRGVLDNTFFVTCRREPDEHQPQRLDDSPREFMEKVLGRDGLQRSASAEYRVGRAEDASMAVVGTIWNDVTRDTTTARYTATLARLLAAEQLAAMRAPGHHDDSLGVEHSTREGDAYARLLRAVREAEMAGHNAEAVLTEAVGVGSLDDALSAADVLRWRVRDRVAQRDPERRVEPGCWTALTPRGDGVLDQFQHDLAVRAEQRQAEIGDAAAEQLPDWAVAHLGLPPVDPDAERQWRRGAGILGGYRELRNIGDDVLSIGEAPSREHELHHALWAQAHQVIGRPTRGPVFARCSDAELREMRDRFAREKQWAPPAVAEQLRTAHTAAAQQRQEHAFAAAKAAMLDPGDERRQLLEQASRAERMAALWAERAVQLEPLHQVRQAWAVSVAEIADLATHAGAELRNRRPAEPVTELAGPVQLDLFTGRPAQPAQPGHSVSVAVQLDLLTGEPDTSQRLEQIVEQRVVGQSAEVPAPTRDTATPGHERQLALVEPTPSLTDEVAAGPVREHELARAGDERERDQAQLSLAQARRHAHAADQQRQLRQLRAERGEGQQVRDLLAAARAERERRQQLDQEPERAIQEAARDRDAELTRLATAAAEPESSGGFLARIKAGLNAIREQDGPDHDDSAAHDYQQRSAAEQTREQDINRAQELDTGYGLEQ